ncbi:MAG: hypothetical protein ACLR0O_05180 [Staphylococcus aureus]
MNYISGPVEFLKYIKGARLILTDSFHGAVFLLFFILRLSFLREIIKRAVCIRGWNSF